jgi:hypothetical protein
MRPPKRGRSDDHRCGANSPRLGGREAAGPWQASVESKPSSPGGTVASDDHDTGPIEDRLSQWELKADGPEGIGNPSATPTSHGVAVRSRSHNC